MSAPVELENYIAPVWQEVFADQESFSLNAENEPITCEDEPITCEDEPITCEDEFILVFNNYTDIYEDNTYTYTYICDKCKIRIYPACPDTEKGFNRHCSVRADQFVFFDEIDTLLDNHGFSEALNQCLGTFYIAMCEMYPAGSYTLDDQDYVCSTKTDLNLRMNEIIKDIVLALIYVKNIRIESAADGFDRNAHLYKSYAETNDEFMGAFYEDFRMDSFEYPQMLDSKYGAFFKACISFYISYTKQPIVVYHKVYDEFGALCK